MKSRGEGTSKARAVATLRRDTQNTTRPEKEKGVRGDNDFFTRSTRRELATGGPPWGGVGGSVRDKSSNKSMCAEIRGNGTRGRHGDKGRRRRGAGKDATRSSTRKSLKTGRVGGGRK